MMKCPVCNRSLAPTISICFTCGAMMNDSVREELQTKITPVSGSLKAEKRTETPAVAAPARPMPVSPVRMEVSHNSNPVSAKMAMPVAPPKPAAAPAPKPLASPIQSVMPAKAAPLPKPPAKLITAELTTPKTSPTLVGFQAKNSTVPDWRLQLANAVRTRKSGPAGEDAAPMAVAPQAQPRTRGANALKTAVAEQAEPAPEPKHKDPRVAAALDRIAQSRKAFLTEDAGSTPQNVAPAEAQRNYPFNIVSRTGSQPVKMGENKATINAPIKPRLVPSIRLEKKEFDTNKLPPVSDVVGTALAMNDEELVTKAPAFSEDASRKRIHTEEEFYDHEEIEVEVDEEEYDDLPQFSMRFNAGLFDMIIGAGASLVLLLPFVIMGGDWFSMSGLIAFIPTCAIVMFIYLTAAVGFYGRTVGMRLFSLELVDADENEYPSLHQAAVNSAVYLLSLAFAGAGFLTVLFNEEKRALHDIVSGTIMVKEF